MTIIAAAGHGRRFGGKKQFLQLEGRPVYYYSINAFKPYTEEVFLVVPQEDVSSVEAYGTTVVGGGERRYDSIYEAIKVTENKLYVEFPQIEPQLPEDIFFITSQELLDLYPELDAKQREDAITKEHRAVFIIGIGGTLSDGSRHDGRAADYDDWSLNGDLLLWNSILDRAFEISSMGIRVDEASLSSQLKAKGEEYKTGLMYHKRLLAGELPLTIGGGIGQSRLCMFLLRKAHIGEIQSSIWPSDMVNACHKAGIELV